MKDQPSDGSRVALRFVLLIGVLSFFADFTYEGARSVTGPYLASLQASAFVVGIVLGAGELLGYGLRLVSGRLADATGRFWPITICGYIVQMAAVPALALTDNWPAAAALIILERIGKAVRNPPRDVMLSYAGKRMGGYGWAFGVHEACDQFGAMLGPLLVAVVLGRRGDYRAAFAVLLVPALLNLLFVTVARLSFPSPEDLDSERAEQDAPRGRFPTQFWVYMAGAALVAAGFADYGLIAYHFTKAKVISAHAVPVMYAIAMATSGGSSLLFGRMFDRHGFPVLIVLTVIGLLFAPLVFFGGFAAIVLGAAIWGMGMGVHESIIPAAVSSFVPADRRASAFGLFTAVYGVFWFAGSAAIGFLYDRSVEWTVAFCVGCQLLALIPFVWVARQARARAGAPGLPRD